MIKRLIFQFLNIFLLLFYSSILNTQILRAMEADGGANTNEQPTGGVVVYQKLAEQLVELYDNGNEHIYTEILLTINQLVYEEQFEALRTILDHTREKNNEILTKKVYNELHTLFQRHFVHDEMRYAQLYSVQCTLAQQFPAMVFHDGEGIEKEKEFAMGLVKSEKRNQEKQKKKNKTCKKENKTDFYATALKRLIGHSDKESFETELQSILHEFAPEDPKQQFDLIEDCCKKTVGVNPEFYVNFFDYLDEKIYKIYFKGIREGQGYKNRVLDLYLLMDNEPSKKSASSSHDFILPQLQNSTTEENPKDTEFMMKIVQTWWEKNCEHQASTIIGDVLFLPTPYAMSCFYMKNNVLFLCSSYEFDQRFPLLITQNEVPDELSEINKKVIEHPIDSSKKISILWASKDPVPTKVLLYKGYLVRGYESGLIKVDGFDHSERNLSFMEDAPITGLLRRGEHSFISSSGTILKFWDIKKKRCVEECRFDGSINDIVRCKRSLYTLIGKGVYNCNHRTKEIPSLVYYEEDSEPTCLSQDAENLYIGLTNGNMKKFTITSNLAVPMKVPRTFEGSVRAISIHEGKKLIQYEKNIVVY
jgi:hypothetical protein